MLISLALAFLTDPPVVDQRADLQRFSARLEQRMAVACRPAEPAVFAAGTPETRFVYLDGVGAVFLLPPRALPNPTPKAKESEPEISVTTARPATPTTPPQVSVAGKPAPVDKTEITDIEAKIRETRKEAERMRAQAEAAFADAERQLMAELRPGLSESSAPIMALPAPWVFFLEETTEDTRTPEQAENDVREALITTILEDSALLKSLEPTDTISVSVDLVSRPQPWVRAKPARTLVVRAQRADLAAYAAGKLTRDDLLKKIQTKAY
jgi:hypothetical protein